MIIKTRGIVLKTKKYSETSVITDIYTEDKGLRSYIIGGVRTKKARVSAGLLQIMSPVEIVAYHREDKDLTRLKEIKPLYVFQTIPFDIRKGAVGMFMTEITRKTLRLGGDSQPELFEFLLSQFIYLDKTELSFSNLHLHFMVHLAGYLGFLPGDSYTPETPFFDLQEGHFSPIQPVHPHWLGPELSQKVSQLILLPIEECHQLEMSRQERRTLLRRLIDYYRLHIEHLPVIHSHEILEEVMGE